MSGEIDLEMNGLFGESETVVLTRARLNRMVNSLTAQLKAGSVTASELAAGAVTASAIADNAIVSDAIAAGAVLTSKLVDGAVTADKLEDAAVGRVALATSALAQVASGALSSSTDLTAGAAAVNLPGVTVTLTPRSANSRFVVMCQLQASSASGGVLTLGGAAYLFLVLAVASGSGKHAGTAVGIYEPATASPITIQITASCTGNTVTIEAGRLVVQEII